MHRQKKRRSAAYNRANETCCKNIDKCTSVSQIMGYEGIAARHYFMGLSKCILPEFGFCGRSRRPPKDEFKFDD